MLNHKNRTKTSHKDPLKNNQILMNEFKKKTHKNPTYRMIKFFSKIKNQTCES